jgi:insulysin
MRPQGSPLTPFTTRLFLTTRPAACALALLAVIFAGACQPKEHQSASVESLLAAERQVPDIRRIVLPNELQVLLVSDPKADRAAASMSVGVGSLSDPQDHPGMAHFLEHMLFLGTAKYPQPGAYQQFITKNSGMTNAYTADEQTTFFFEVANDSLPEGLDRFAQFFIAPTLDQTYAQRELNAVDSEHAKNMESDAWRSRQILREQYEEGHPIRKFGTGNRDTLKGVGRKELTAFYQSQYSSNRMTLAVVGRAKLDELEALVRQNFSQVEDRHLPPTHFPTEYLKPEAALRVVTIEPVADIRRLTLIFPLPPVQQDYRAKPLGMIAAVLGHEGEGSLLSLLKEQDLATSLSAGEGEATKDYSSMELDIGLTPKGLDHYQDVISRVLGTIAQLRQRNIPRRFFDEYRKMAELSFKYRERLASAQQAEQLSSAMQAIPMADLPDALYQLTVYAPERYEELLGHMTPDNMIVDLVAKGVPVDQTERYYHARYGVHVYAGKEYAQLTKPPEELRWHVPAPNPFIPTDVTVLTPHGPLLVTDTTFHWLRADGVPAEVIGKLLPFLGVTFASGNALVSQATAVLTPAEQSRYLAILLKDALAVPVRVLDGSAGQVWYVPDWRFRQPKADVILKLFVPGSYQSARQVVLAQLYEQGLEESLNEFGYPVKEAGLDYGIDTVKSGIALTLSGFSPRMPQLLDKLVERLPTMDITQERFDAVKERYRRGLENQKFDQPYEQTQYFLEQLLEKPSVPTEALLGALDSVTLADVQAYAKQLYGKLYIQGVISGNIAPDDARAMVGRVLAKLHAQPLPPDQRVEEQPRLVPPGSDYTFSDRLPGNNSLSDVYYQAGLSAPRLRGALQIIARPLGESYYFNMRTQQQLGYAVFAGLGQTERMLYLYFLVQSGNFGADLLQERTDAFIPQFIGEFSKLPPETFQKYKTAVIQAKLQRDRSPSEQARRLFYVAFRLDRDWDYLSDEIRAVESLRQAEVNAVLTRTLSGRDRRRLVIRLIGKGHEVRPVRGQAITLPSKLPAAS